jgi:hypothetical protein
MPCTCAGTGAGCNGSAGAPVTDPRSDVARIAATCASTSSTRSPGSHSTAINMPTGSVDSGSTSKARTTPSCQHSMSIAALDVSTMAITWPLCTASPGRTSHCSSLPWSMSEPSEGMRNWIIVGLCALRVQEAWRR